MSWTVDGLTAAQIATNREATGDVLVVLDGWCFSTVTGTGITGCILNLYRPRDGYTPAQRDPRDGEAFPSTEEAEAYAYAKGHLGWFRRSVPDNRRNP